ncbi:hypothetical protein QQZ08_000538 [Neonectria magnoliae]|uniref:DUF5597 domain-containing protein n=1 Tax=Neonectria magnoliae TaxID=2732573 RepID=A0ABR1IID5_9HYPO
MVQVENEVGLLGNPRDACPKANATFSEPIPGDLFKFLAAEWTNLHPDLKFHLPNIDSVEFTKRQGQNWEAAFGKGPKTDKIFMAYHYESYVNYVAEAGKPVYSLPLFTNIWMNYVGEDSDNDFPTVVGDGGLPGDYPSGGATSNVLDIWQRFAPNLAFISLDVYFSNYTRTCEEYRHRGQPLFIPEQRRDAYGARRIWVAYGSFATLGKSPISDIVLEAQTRPDSSIGFYFDEVPDNMHDTVKPTVYRFGDFELIIERFFVFGKLGPAEGMMIHQTRGRFWLIGWGFQVQARALSAKANFTGILRFEEKTPEGCPSRGAAELEDSEW